jgi:DNA-binding transcriptional regulator YiaG
MKVVSMKTQNYSLRLKQLRLRMKLSLREMAVEFRVCHGAIQHWESGARAIPGPVTKLIEILETQFESNIRNNPYV